MLSQEECEIDKPEEESFQDELKALINKHSEENGSDTPDFILANYMKQCLDAFNVAVSRREEWYGRPPHSWDVLQQYKAILDHLNKGAGKSE